MTAPIIVPDDDSTRHALDDAILRATGYRPIDPDIILRALRLRLGVAIERQRVAELTPEEIASAVARIDTHELRADEAMFAGKRAAEGMANIVRALALLSTVPRAEDVIEPKAVES